MGPVTLHGFGGDAERLGYFLVLQAREVPQLDDLGLDCILSRQVVQGFIDLEDLVLFRLCYELGFIERHALLTAAVAKPPFTPDVFHQDAPHGFGRGGKEMATSFPARLAVSDQSQPCFVDQRRGLKRLSRRLLAHLVGCETAQFLINQRQQFRSSFGITLLCAVQNARDVAHARRITKEPCKLQARAVCLSNVLSLVQPAELVELL